MNPEHIPFNALIVGPTGCGKTQFITQQLLGDFKGKFDVIVLFCPAYVNNRTWSDGAIGASIFNDDDFFVDILDPNTLSDHLKFWYHNTKPKKNIGQIIRCFLFWMTSPVVRMSKIVPQNSYV